MAGRRRPFTELLAMGVIAALVAFGLAYSTRPGDVTRTPAPARPPLSTHGAVFELHPGGVAAHGQEPGRRREPGHRSRGRRRRRLRTRSRSRARTSTPSRAASRDGAGRRRRRDAWTRSSSSRVDSAHDALTLVADRAARPRDRRARRSRCAPSSRARGRSSSSRASGRSPTARRSRAGRSSSPRSLIRSPSRRREGPRPRRRARRGGGHARPASRCASRPRAPRARRRAIGWRSCTSWSASRAWSCGASSRELAGTPTAPVRGRVTGTGERALVIGRDAQGNPQVRALASEGGAFALDVPAERRRVVRGDRPGTRERARDRSSPGTPHDLVLDVSPGRRAPRRASSTPTRTSR